MNFPKCLINHPGIRKEHCVTRLRVMHCVKNKRLKVYYIYIAVYSKLENQYQEETTTAVRCKLFIMLFILHYCKSVIKVPIAANQKDFVYKIKVNPIHTILKYGDYHDFMDR